MHTMKTLMSDLGMWLVTLILGVVYVAGLLIAIVISLVMLCMPPPANDPAKVRSSD